jgi:FMN phosphatase YigB (HAD superfamily)/ribonuclease HI
MRNVRAHPARRQQTRRLNAVIDEAFSDRAAGPRQRLLRLFEPDSLQQLAERIRQRATRLGKRQPRDTRRIVGVRDDLITALYAAAAPKGWATAWCDGSRMNVGERHRAGIGGIVMDGNGAEIARISEAIGRRSALAAELAALAAVIRSAIEHRQRRLWAYTDNRRLAQLWREQRADDRLAEIRRLVTQMEGFALSPIPRQHNQPANALARQAARDGRPGPIRAVLFDFGGVVAEEGFRDGLVALAAEQGLDAGHTHREGVQAVYDSGFVLGKGTEADFWALMRRRTGLAGADDKLTGRILDGFVIRPWMIDLVRQLSARGYVTGILSDQTHWLDTLNQRDNFYEAFDRIYNSYYRGKGKQDPSQFTDVAADLGLPPAAILFVDDDPGNVTRARAAGLHAIQFVDRASFTRELERLLPDDPKQRGGETGTAGTK